MNFVPNPVPLIYHFNPKHTKFECSDISRIIDVDDFIAELWKIHQKVKKEGYIQVVLSYYHCTVRANMLEESFPRTIQI